MFKRILLAIDGSKYSNEALPAALELAQKFQSEMVILHVSEHDRGRAVVYAVEAPATATVMVGDAVKKARDAGITANGRLTDVAAGHVAKAIVETAVAIGAELIVLGSRGVSDVQALMVGSVTHKVMQTADVPVLVVRGPRRKTPATNGFASTFKA